MITSVEKRVQRVSLPPILKFWQKSELTEVPPCNEEDNVPALGGTALGLIRCSVSESFKECGMDVLGEGKYVEAVDSTTSGNKNVGLHADEQAAVYLDKCELASNIQHHVKAEDGAVVRLAS